MKVSPVKDPRDPTIHFIIARSRAGWAVNVNSDRLSDHATSTAARAWAETLAQRTREAGQTAEVVDLSQHRGA